MNKTVLALAVVAFSVGGVGTAMAATPQTATSTSAAPSAPMCATSASRPLGWNAAYLANWLKENKVPYDSIVNTANNCLSVAVRDFDGGINTEIFNPVTLHRVS